MAKVVWTEGGVYPPTIETKSDGTSDGRDNEYWYCRRTDLLIDEIQRYRELMPTMVTVLISRTSTSIANQI